MDTWNWKVILKDSRDSESDKPLSEASFRTSADMRRFLDSYMELHGKFVEFYTIYHNGTEHEHVSN